MSKRPIKKNINNVTSDIDFAKKIAIESLKERTPYREKAYASLLNNLGRKAYFDEWFYGIKPENQVYEKLEGIENIIETICFKRGYERGRFLVEQGIIPPEYQEVQNKLHR